MNWKMNKFNNLCKITFIFRSYNSMSDEPVQSYSRAGDFKIFFADKIRNLFNRNQNKIFDFTIIVGGFESFRQFKIKHILCIRLDAPLTFMKKRNNTNRFQAGSKIFRNIRFFSSFFDGSLEYTIALCKPSPDKTVLKEKIINVKNKLYA